MKVSSEREGAVPDVAPLPVCQGAVEAHRRVYGHIVHGERSAGASSITALAWKRKRYIHRPLGTSDIFSRKGL